MTQKRRCEFENKDSNTVAYSNYTKSMINIPIKIRTYRNSCMFDMPSRKPVPNSQF